MNPILAMLQNNRQPNVLSQINQIRNFLNGKNPDELFSKMYSENPQFRQFIDENKNKTPEQVARENGISLK